LGALGLHIEVGTEEVDTVVGSEVGTEADIVAAGSEVGREAVAGGDCWSIHLASLYPC
jgi:hypothetical protein